MENIVLKQSKKVIVDCRSFTKEGKVFFSIDYVDYQKTGNKYKTKDWIEKDQLEKVIKFSIFDHSILPASFDKKSDDEICQELKGKSLIIEQKISYFSDIVK